MTRPEIRQTVTELMELLQDNVTYKLLTTDMSKLRRTDLSEMTFEVNIDYDRAKRIIDENCGYIEELSSKDVTQYSDPDNNGTINMTRTQNLKRTKFTIR